MLEILTICCLIQSLLFCANAINVFLWCRNSSSLNKLYVDKQKPLKKKIYMFTNKVMTMFNELTKL